MVAARQRGRVGVLIALLAMPGSWLGGAVSARDWTHFVAILVVFAAATALRSWRHLVNALRVLPRDLRFFANRLRAQRMLAEYERDNATLVGKLEERARRTPDEACFLFEDERWTYRDVDGYSNRVARAFLRAGVRRGDVVALLMGNRVELVCAWLGLAKAGAVAALLNAGLRGAPLAHAVNAAGARLALCDHQLVGAMQAVRAELRTAHKFFRLGGPPHTDGDNDDWVPLLPLLAAESADRAAPSAGREPAFNDTVMYLFTSGTTGLPKAAVITNARLLFWPVDFFVRARLAPGRDVHYCPLPLYHAAAGAFAASLALSLGVTVALAARFSASRFWADTARHGATTAQYLGELSRFLAVSPESPLDRRHAVRALVGHGMSAAVWRRVQARFGVPEVVELYGATEGNILLVNGEGRVGAIGFVPLLLPRALRPDVELVRVDAATEKPVRDAASGLCVRCEHGEPGMMVGMIRDESIRAAFVGYLDEEATAKKVLMNVFAPCDRYFLTGDLAVMDELGYLYFKGRTGDTYRWKGENVAEAEVEAALSAALLPLGVREVAAFGVAVPGYDGRAGMAAVADPGGRLGADLAADRGNTTHTVGADLADKHSALADLAADLARRLPRYAQPVFLRVAAALPLTGTHKVSKVGLRREGLRGHRDPVYVLHAGLFRRLTDAVLEDIRDGRMRL